MDAPDGLGSRGADLWRLIDARLDLTGPAGIVAHEACRIADRLEGMDDVIRGKGVLQLMHFRSVVDTFEAEDSRNITLKVDAVFSEARQQQGRLAHLLATLGVEAAPKKAATPPTGQQSGGTVLDELQAKRGSGGSGASAAGTPRTARRRTPRDPR